ncbi:hypothetical protein LX66_5580 [Chitinophaga japonensis]|uniref:Uncharacterized protein n=1 Tax=Chitinophaga japonensis TaxID=104662 RepID=A0A562SI67_CHIJA|nr:hypothetical protein LX66_5580 [Chitinophaga japonensis]
MEELINRILPAGDSQRKWVSVGLTVLIAGLLTCWGIYDNDNFCQYYSGNSFCRKG